MQWRIRTLSFGNARPKRRDLRACAFDIFHALLYRFDAKVNHSAAEVDQHAMFCVWRTIFPKMILTVSLQNCRNIVGLFFVQWLCLRKVQFDAADKIAGLRFRVQRHFGAHTDANSLPNNVWRGLGAKARFGISKIDVVKQHLERFYCVDVASDPARLIDICRFLLQKRGNRIPKIAASVMLEAR